MASIAQRNHKLKKGPPEITTSTLRQKVETRSGPWMPPPPIAGVLQASPPRSKGQLLGSPLPTKICCRGPPPSCGEQITSQGRGFEHPRRGQIMASSSEVANSRVVELEKIAPFRQQPAPDGDLINFSSPSSTSMARQREEEDADRPHPTAELDEPGSCRSRERSSASPLSLASKAGREKGRSKIHQDLAFLLLAAAAGQEKDLILASTAPADIHRRFIEDGGSAPPSAVLQP